MARIKGEQLAAIRDAIEPIDTLALRKRFLSVVLPGNPAIKDPDRRYRWDLFHHVNQMSGWTLLRDGDTDAHIDTALRAIVPPL